MLNIIIVIAEIFGYTVLIKHKHSICQLIDKITVMADYEQSTAIVGKCFSSSSLDAESRWFVGSSSKRKLLPLSISFASEILALSPPLILKEV